MRLTVDCCQEVLRLTIRSLCRYEAGHCDLKVSTSEEDGQEPHHELRFLQADRTVESL